jgi:hypothetical protein
MVQQEKQLDAVELMCESFRHDIQRCVQCQVILECAYPKNRLKPLQEHAKKMADDIYEEELELDNSAENRLRAEEKRTYSYNVYLKNHAFEVLKNDRCVYERDEVLKTLQSFSDNGYDLSDPRIYLIVKELISNILISGRANKSFTNLGVLIRRETPGGPVYYANPLLKHKFEFSQLVTESIESLDRILKSDVKQSKDKSFTAHLMNQLKIRGQKEKLRLEGPTEEGVLHPGAPLHLDLNIEIEQNNG